MLEYRDICMQGKNQLIYILVASTRIAYKVANIQMQTHFHILSFHKNPWRRKLHYYKDPHFVH